MNPINSQDSQIVDPDDLDNNPSTSPHLADLVAARLSRRQVMVSGVGAMAVAGLGSLALTATDEAQAQSTIRPSGTAPRLDFDPIGKTIDDVMRVATGYRASVIYATGDSIDPLVSDYAGDGSETN
jgi:uncharacterized protein